MAGLIPGGFFLCPLPGKRFGDGKQKLAELSHEGVAEPVDTVMVDAVRSPVVDGIDAVRADP